MTTLNIGVLEVNNPNIKTRTLEEIKYFLTQILESDLISNINIKKRNWDKVDKELRSLKVINKKSAEELEKSLKILGNEVDRNEVIWLMQKED